MTEIQEIVENVKRRKISNIEFQWIGATPSIRSKISDADFLESHIRDGIGIGKIYESLNIIDEVVPGFIYGPESSEFRIVPDTQTFAPLPYTPHSARFICEIKKVDLSPSEMDTRFFLRQVIEKSLKKGFKVMAAFEPEFNLFLEEGGKIVSPFTYVYGSPLASFSAATFLNELVDSIKKMGIKVERLLKEAGPSAFEIQMRYADGLKAADDMVTFRVATKCIAKKHGMDATFLPKPAQLGRYTGTGMHVHISLWDSQGKKNLFYDAEDTRGLDLSETGYFFIGGILKHIRALCLLGAPLVNSYKRLLDGTTAPSRVFYAGDHRDAAIRIPSPSVSGRQNSARIEYRVPDPTANPYLTLGSLVAAGLYGIENKIDPGEPITERIFELTEKERERLGVGEEAYLPRTLGEAILEMEESKFLKDLLGDILYTAYISNRKSEWKNFREHVTDWEIYKFIDIF